MNMIRPEDQTVPGEVQRRPNRIIGFFLHFMLPVAVLACGVAITVYLMKTSPEARPAKRPPTATLVEVRKVQVGPQQTVLEAMGEIVPAREIDVKPRVGGEVVEVSREFLPGGHFRTGQTMLRIDPVDYTLVMRQLESEAEKARSDLAIEMGSQRIAEKEFVLLGETVSAEERALILREPQLAKLQATLAATEAKLAQAKLDLARTEIQAPFNGVIHSRSADVGARVNESTVLAHLAGTDAFWLRLTLPVEQLQWLDIPRRQGDTGSQVRIYPQSGSSSGQYRVGRVIRLEAALETQGRMAQLLVEIDDPLCLKPENSSSQPLLLGSFVRAELVGKPIPTAITVDRANLHEGNRVWLMDGEGQLEIREVAVIFKNRDQVIIEEGLADGERLVVSPLSSPVAGTPLRLAGDTGVEKVQPAAKPGGKRRAE